MLKSSRSLRPERSFSAAVSPIAYVTGDRPATSLHLRQIRTGTDVEIVPPGEDDRTELTFLPMEATYISYRANYGNPVRDSPSQRELSVRQPQPLWEPELPGTEGARGPEATKSFQLCCFERGLRHRVCGLMGDSPIQAFFQISIWREMDESLLVPSICKDDRVKR